MSSKEEDILEVWSGLIESHALAVREVQRGISGKAPLTLDEYDVLLVISRSPDQRLRFSALADATIYTRSGISRIASRLEDEGYLAREQCPEDGRGYFAVLTDSGKRALRDTWKWYSDAVIKTLGAILSQSEARELKNLLGKVAQVMRREPLVQIRTK